jgi:hypothetical protein
MGEGKVRCQECGAKNSDPLADRCRVCSAMLPDAQRRRMAAIGATTAGPAFAELVESEVAAWKEYAEGRNRRSRGASPGESDQPGKSRFSLRRSSKESSP